MKALPTVYAGVTFRSRLEADWAMTLDDRRISWQYEPEGYELSDGTCYSPDFYLPGVKAWLEVKGDHMLGVSKVGQFATELWEESGIDTPLDKGAPMVLLGQTPHPADNYAVKWEQTRMLGIRAPGKQYSVSFAVCPACQQPTILALWQKWCRTCGADTDEQHDQEWHDSTFNSFMRPFRRITRPAGRGRR